MNKDWKELVIARYKCLPKKYVLNIGTWMGTSVDAVREIEQETGVGEFLVNVERQYLTSLKDGWLRELLNQ